MREDAVTIDSKEGAAVTGAGQEAAVGGESEGIDDIFAGRPKLFRCAVGANPVNAAGKKRGKWKEGLLRLDLPGTHDGASEGSRTLWRGDDRDGSLSRALLFPNRGGIDGAVGRDGKRSDFALGSFVQNEALSPRCGRILGVLR